MNRLTIAQLRGLAPAQQPYRQDKGYAEMQMAKAREKRQRRAQKNLKTVKTIA